MEIKGKFSNAAFLFFPSTKIMYSPSWNTKGNQGSIMSFAKGSLC